MNTVQSYPLASDHSWKDLTAVLEADEVRPIHRHSADQSHSKTHPAQKCHIWFSQIIDKIIAWLSSLGEIYKLE